MQTGRSKGLSMKRKPRCHWAALTGTLCIGAGAPPVPPVPVVFGDVALEYRGLPGCPDESVFRQRMADLYRFHDPFVPEGAAATSRIGIAIERAGKGYRGTLS